MSRRYEPGFLGSPGALLGKWGGKWTQERTCALCSCAFIAEHRCEKYCGDECKDSAKREQNRQASARQAQRNREQRDKRQIDACRDMLTAPGGGRK